MRWVSGGEAVCSTRLIRGGRAGRTRGAIPRLGGMYGPAGTRYSCLGGPKQSLNATPGPTQSPGLGIGIHDSSAASGVNPKAWWAALWAWPRAVPLLQLTQTFTYPRPRPSPRRTAGSIPLRLSCDSNVGEGFGRGRGPAISLRNLSGNVGSHRSTPRGARSLRSLMHDATHAQWPGL